MRNNTIKKSISQILLAIFLISATGCSEALKQSSSSNEGSALSETGVVIEGTVALSSDQIQGASAGHILFAAQTGKEGEVELFLLKDGEKEESTGKKADVVGGAYKFEGVDPKETYLIGYKHKESEDVSAKSLVIIDEKSTDKKVSIKTDVESNYITQYFLDEVKDQGLSEAIDKDTLKAFVSVVKKVVKQLLTEEKLEEKVSTSADFFDGSFSKIDEDEQVKAVSEEVAVARLESEISKKDMDTESETTEVDGKRIEKRESIDGTIVEEKIFSSDGKLIESKFTKTTSDGETYVQTRYFDEENSQIKSKKVVTPSKTELDYRYAEPTDLGGEAPALMKKEVKLEDGYELISEYSDGEILSQNGDLYDPSLGVSFQIDSSWIRKEADIEKGLRYVLESPDRSEIFSMSYPKPGLLFDKNIHHSLVKSAYNNIASSGVDQISISGKSFIRVSVVDTDGKRLFHYFHFLEEVYNKIGSKAYYEFIYHTDSDSDSLAQEILSGFKVKQEKGVPASMAVGVPLTEHKEVGDRFDVAGILQLKGPDNSQEGYSQDVHIHFDNTASIISLDGTVLTFNKEGAVTIVLRSKVAPDFKVEMTINVKDPKEDILFSEFINENWVHADADIKKELMTLLGVSEPISSFSTEEKEVIKHYKNYSLFDLTLDDRAGARELLERLRATMIPEDNRMTVFKFNEDVIQNIYFRKYSLKLNLRDIITYDGDMDDLIVTIKKEGDPSFLERYDFTDPITELPYTCILISVGKYNIRYEHRYYPEKTIDFDFSFVKNVTVFSFIGENNTVYGADDGTLVVDDSPHSYFKIMNDLMDYKIMKYDGDIRDVIAKITTNGNEKIIKGEDIKGHFFSPGEYDVELTHRYYLDKKVEFSFSVVKPIPSFSPYAQSPLHSGNRVTDMVIDDEGNIYVLDWKTSGEESTDVVIKFDSSGKYLTSFGKTGNPDTEIVRPLHMVFHNNYLYILDTLNFTTHVNIQKFTLEGEYVETFDLAGINQYAVDFDIDQVGNFVLLQHYKIIKLDKNLEVLKEFEHEVNSSLVGIAVDSNGLIYIGESSQNIDTIHQFSSEGEKIRTIGSKGSGEDQFDMLNELMIDRNTNELLVGSLGTYGLQWFDSEGQLKSVNGNKDLKTPGFRGPASFVDTNKKETVVFSLDSILVISKEYQEDGAK